MLRAWSLSAAVANADVNCCYFVIAVGSVPSMTVEAACQGCQKACSYSSLFFFWSTV